MSRRAEQIEAHAKEHGLIGQAARRVSFYATRGAKEKVSLETLHGQWHMRLGQHEQAVSETRGAAEKIGERAVEVAPQLAARSMLFGIRQSEGKEAVNNLGRLLQVALASHVGEVRLCDVRPLAEDHEARWKLLATRHPTGDEVLTRGRTTRRTARLELALSDQLALALGDSKPLSSAERLIEEARSAGLNAGQREALLHLGTSADRVIGVHGVAGAGKSTLVGALREAADPTAILIAAAPTSSAADELGKKAEIESRTVANLLAGGGRGLDDRHTLVIDEAGQLGNRQAIRLLEISRLSGARLILLGDNLQTGAIEQGKPFWLMQKLGLPKVELTESIRQQSRTMRAAVTQARLGNYAESIGHLDKVTSGESSEMLAASLVGEWTRLSAESRGHTNILVLENATRLIVNTKVREALKREGAVAAEDARLSILAPSGMTDQEKQFARFFLRGQVVTFARDNAGLGIARDAEYRVTGLTRDSRGRQKVSLVDENGRTIQWDPRLGRASQINVFKEEDRQLAAGDRIQWRLVNHELGIKNAERGTVERLDGTIAAIRWDRDGHVRQVDLSQHRTWDHGYAETIYAAQSKTYDRVYVLAPVNSPLVTGQNYYTAITRARFGVKLWSEDPGRLAEKLTQKSGEKTSSLEGLGRIDRSSVRGRARQHGERLERLREQQHVDRETRRAEIAAARANRANQRPGGLSGILATRAQSAARTLDQWLVALIDRGRGQTEREPSREPSRGEPPAPTPTRGDDQDRGGGHDR